MRRSSRIAGRQPAEPAQPAAKRQRRAPTAPPAAAAAATASTAPLAIGDALPDITLVNQHGEPVRVRDYTQAVIFAYPRANTPGCTRQAQHFRDDYAEWAARGYAVCGVSIDAPGAQLRWATRLALPYTLLSDPERVLIGALTGSTATTRRSDFVVRDGRLAAAHLGVRPDASSAGALAAT